MWVLTLQYLTHAGAEVQQRVPWFTSLDQCRAWLAWTIRTLEINGATAIVAACDMVG